MTKEKHSLASKLFRLQAGLRKITSALPPPKRDFSNPMLTLPEPFGPDSDRFKQPQQALLSWNDKQSQWWHFTGAVKTRSNREYGFGISFFDRRTQAEFIGIVPMSWIQPRGFAAHFVWIDAKNATPAKTYRFWQRGGLPRSLAGKVKAAIPDDRFFLEVADWYAKENERGFEVRAVGDGVSATLQFTPRAPLVLHGQAGYSQRDGGVNSYSCSYPGMEVSGTIVIDGRVEDITGAGCLDHEKVAAARNRKPEWTSAGEQSCPHDRVQCRFDSGESLFLEFTSNDKRATWIGADGSVSYFVGTELQVSTLEYWKSPMTGGRYPVHRKISIPALKLELEIRAVLPQQEIHSRRAVLAASWQGALQIRGELAGKAINGSGFQSLTGYDVRPLTRALQFLTAP